jgi:hypothetical protein
MKLSVSFAIAALATGFVASSATAGIPVVSVRVEQVGAGSIELVPVGVPENDGGYAYSGTVSVWGFLADFGLRTATKDGGNQSFGGALNFTNLSASTQEFAVTFTVSTVPTLNPTLCGGSISGILDGGADGGFFSSVGNGSVWSALVRNGGSSTTVANLLTGSPYIVNANAADKFALIPAEQFGSPIPSQPGPALGDSRFIRMRFLLSAGDTVSLGTTFVVQEIPGPGALALMGAFGTRLGRRRRG